MTLHGFQTMKMLEEEKLARAKRFKVEDLGELHYVLGMSVKRDPRSITLSIAQKKYLEEVLKTIQYGKLQASIHSTHATTIRRLDLADAVGVLSKFKPKPGKEHWQDTERMSRYIQGALNYIV